MSETITPTGVKREQKRTPVKCTAVTKGNFQREGTLTAELRQKVRTISTYPGMQISNEFNQNVFDLEDFGTKGRDYTSEETRVCWIDVPVGTSVADVQKRIPKGACLYRVLSNSPILTSGHKNAIARKLTTLDTIADAQALRYPAGHADEGKLILDSEGRVQYRKIFFWKEHKEDQDNRGGEEYRSKAIKAELGESSPVSVEAEIVMEEEWEK